ncbi:hypothetical protein HDV05_001873 [Chytridiales sp. JEL 0842]|nr:hypothetical protein HDV05_001873 [Chytridiales sp. JEL 0842]
MSVNFTNTVVLDDASARTGLAVCLTIYIVYGLGALAFSFFSKEQNIRTVDSEFFVTARNSQSTMRIAWSFFAGAMGAWTLYGPAAFVADPAYGTGLIGLIVYALFTGLPLVMVSLMGSGIRDNVPHATSIASYGRWRYGKVVEVFVMMVVLLTLTVGLIVEYMTIGGIFATFFGTPTYLPVIVVGVVTLLYTSAGGLYVSIITDQFQAVVALLLISFSVIYMGVSFKDSPLPALPEYLGVTEAGWTTFGTIALPLTCATFFSEAFWQRVWAARDNRSLRIGAMVGGALATFVVFLLGFGGMLAFWSGRATAESDSNFGFFYAFSNANGTTSAAVTIVVIVFACIMNESAVDSFQNAITDTLTTFGGFLGFQLPIYATRLTCLVANIPIVIGSSILASQGTSILQAFLLGNMITTITFPPLALGLVPAFNRILSGWSVIGACIGSFFCVLGYGISVYGDASLALSSLFWSSLYDWKAFLVAFGCSTGLVFLFGGLECTVRALLGMPMQDLPRYEKVSKVDGDVKTGDYLVSRDAEAVGQTETLVNNN